MVSVCTAGDCVLLSDNLLIQRQGLPLWTIDLLYYVTIDLYIIIDLLKYFYKFTLNHRLLDY